MSQLALLRNPQFALDVAAYREGLLTVITDVRFDTVGASEGAIMTGYTRLVVADSGLGSTVWAPWSQEEADACMRGLGLEEDGPYKDGHPRKWHADRDHCYGSDTEMQNSCASDTYLLYHKKLAEEVANDILKTLEEPLAELEAALVPLKVNYRYPDMPFHPLKISDITTSAVKTTETSLRFKAVQYGYKYVNGFEAESQEVCWSEPIELKMSPSVTPGMVVIPTGVSLSRKILTMIKPTLLWRRRSRLRRQLRSPSRTTGAHSAGYTGAWSFREKRLRRKLGSARCSRIVMARDYTSIHGRNSLL